MEGVPGSPNYISVVVRLLQFKEASTAHMSVYEK